MKSADFIKLATKYVGKSGSVKVGTMQVAVKIHDVRSMFGRIDLEVEPVAGSGSTWVEDKIVTLTKSKALS